MEKQVLEEILKKIEKGEIELICQDERGTIHKLMHEGHEYIVVYTVKNEVRGGDYHQTVQHDIVLNGRIFWKKKTCLSCPEGNGEDGRIVEEDEEFTTEPNVPHMLVSLGTESLVLEWLEGPFEKQYYRPYRDQVERPLEEGDK